MTLRTYELAVVVRGSVGADKQKDVIEGVTSLVKKLAGTVNGVVSGDKQLLAYDIGKEREAFYHYFALSLPGNQVAPIQAKLKQNEAILRLLLITNEKKKERKDGKK